MSTVAHFEALHAQADPWGYRDRWYEQRKRALLLASLAAPRYRRGLEIGCSSGELTAALAMRCDTLIATDCAANAVAQARTRLRTFGHVQVLHQLQPVQWPDGRFDLVVVSEVGYYLDPPGMQALATRIGGSLDADALLVACHWRRPFGDRVLATDAVHATLAALPLTPLFDWSDADMRLQGWSTRAASVAEREGLA